MFISQVILQEQLIIKQAIFSILPKIYVSYEVIAGAVLFW